jgi:hypothetical protein
MSIVTGDEFRSLHVTCMSSQWTGSNVELRADRTAIPAVDCKLLRVVDRAQPLVLARMVADA